MAVIDLSIAYIPSRSRSGPLFRGQIFVGEPDTTNDLTIPANQKEVTLVQENGSRVVAQQPIITNDNGQPTLNGSPVVMETEGTYRLQILDRNGVQAYNVPIAGGEGNTVTDLRAAALYLNIPFTDIGSRLIGSVIGTSLDGAEFLFNESTGLVFRLPNNIPTGSTIVSVSGTTLVTNNGQFNITSIISVTDLRAAAVLTNTSFSDIGTVLISSVAGNLLTDAVFILNYQTGQILNAPQTIADGSTITSLDNDTGLLTYDDSGTERTVTLTEFLIPDTEGIQDVAAAMFTGANGQVPAEYDDANGKIIIEPIFAFAILLDLPIGEIGTTIARSTVGQLLDGSSHLFDLDAGIGYKLPSGIPTGATVVSVSGTTLTTSDGQFTMTEDALISRLIDDVVFVEGIQDIAGGLFTDNETVGISSSYNDETGKIDLSVGSSSLTQQGIVLLSNSINGSRQNVAATERAVRDAALALSFASDAGGIGTYMAARATPPEILFGEVVNGSRLRPVDFGGSFPQDPPRDGMWRCMGRTRDSNTSNLSTIFLRIS